MADTVAPADVQRRALGAGAVSFATVAWGLVPLILKQVDMSPLAFATWRVWFGVLVYTAVLAATGRRLRWRTIRATFLGGLFFAGDIALVFHAFKLTSVANATIIGALSPVFIALGAAKLFGERIERRDLGFVVASFVGVAVVAVGSTGSPTWSPSGDLFAAGSTLSWTAYWLYSKRARSNVSALEYMTSVMLVAAVTLTLVSLGTGTSLAPPQGIDWMWIWIVTLIPGAMGHLFVAWSHRHLDAWMASLITQMMPVVSSIAAWVLLGETLTPLAIAGGILVLAATIAIVLRVSRRTDEEIEPPTAAPVTG